MLEREYIGMKDVYDYPIYMSTLLHSALGRYFMVVKDEDLGYTLFDVFNRTTERLTPEIAKMLVVIPDEREMIYAA